VTLGTNREVVSPLSVRWKAQTRLNASSSARNTPATVPRGEHASSYSKPTIKIWREPETPSVSSSDSPSILIQNLSLQDSPLLSGESPRKTGNKILARKLLVVEKNAFSRKIMLTKATKAGFSECDEAKDETEALQMYRILALQSVFYFAIFVSVDPSLQGNLAFVQHIRSLEQASSYPHTRIYALGEVLDSACASLFDQISTSYLVQRAEIEEGLVCLNQP
jgi:hypothetical protein